MDVINIISLTKDILLGLSAIAVAFFAWLGLKTWRKELTGKAKFEAARNMMHLALGLQASLKDALNPFTNSYEFIGREKQESESPGVSQVLGEWYARVNRLKPIVERFNKIVEAQWDCEVLLSVDSVKPIKEAVQSYRESYAELSSAITSYFDTRVNEVKTGIPYKDYEWMKGLHKIIYGVEQNFIKKIDEATEKLSVALKQYVK
jgi:hypothetical protein